MSKTQKFIVTILVISVLYTVLCFPVSAEYISTYDHGIYYTNMYNPYTLINSGGAGERMTDSVSIVPMWALDSYEAGKTYTFTFRCTISPTVNNHLNKTGIYLNTSHKARTSIVLQDHLSKAFRSIEYDETTKQMTFTVKLNTDIVDLGGFPIYIYFYVPFDGTEQDPFHISYATNGWGITVEKDAGGSEYVQSLVDEVAQMRQNDENFYSSALQTLDAIKQNSDALPDNIRQILQERDQNEKQEAQTETDEGITSIKDSLQNVIPVNSIIDSIQPLYNSCTYEGIQSIWTLPGISIPAIDGVIGETSISSDIQFDMVEFADQYIPDSLLSLIRSLNGTGIIVFSVYEVISLINQVITGNFKEKETVDL